MAASAAPSIIDRFRQSVFLRNGDFQSVEIIAEVDLARQARIFVAMVRAVEQVAFVLPNPGSLPTESGSTFPWAVGTCTAPPAHARTPSNQIARNNFLSQKPRTPSATFLLPPAGDTHT